MDYQSNSNKSKDQEKKTVVKKEEIVKIVTADVIEKPKGLGHKFKTIFFGGDFKQAMRTVAGDVILPAIRSLIVESVSKGAERVIYGDSYTRRREVDYRPRVQYNNPFRQPDPRTMGRVPDQGPRSYRVNRRDVNDIIIQSRDEAEAVVERLIDVIDKYEFVSVGDLNGILGLESSHVDEKWGWT